LEAGEGFGDFIQLVVMMFSISELACASSNGSVLMSTAGFGMSSPACFNSASAARAAMQRLRMALLSNSAFGGNSGSALNGAAARHATDVWRTFCQRTP